MKSTKNFSNYLALAKVKITFQLDLILKYFQIFRTLKSMFPKKYVNRPHCHFKKKKEETLLYMQGGKILCVLIPERQIR